MTRLCAVTSLARVKARSRRVLSALAILLGASGLLLVSGCGATNGLKLSGGSTSSDSDGAAFGGKMYGGQNPVTNAAVTLYAVNTSTAPGTGTGYGSAARELYSTTTDSNGDFSFPVASWTCSPPPNDQVFLVGVGGNAGGGANANLVQMAALGSCSAINAETFVVMNEVTTVASAYSLGGFLTYSSGNVDTPPTSTVTAGTVPFISIPTSGSLCNSGSNWTSNAAKSCNYVGIKNAMLTVQNLVNISTGNVPTNYKVPSYTTITAGNDSFSPSARVNTLANILSSCVNSTGGVEGDGSNCGTLFASTVASTGVYPTDTLQAILFLAQYPYLTAANNTNFFNLVSKSPAFNTPASMSAKPNDWALALGYTTGGFTNNTTGGNAETISEGMAIDQQGNIWASSTADQNTNTGGMVGITNSGTHISPITTSTSAWGAWKTNANFPFSDPAIDPSGNLYFANAGDGSFAAINQSGGSVLAAVEPPFSGHDIDGTTPTGIAVDSSDNIYLLGTPAAGGAAAGRFNSSGANQWYFDSTAVPVSGYSGISLDQNGNVWFSSNGAGEYQLNASTGAEVHFYSGSGNQGELSVASTGDVFGCATSYVIEDLPGGPSFTQYNSGGGCYASNEFGPNSIDGLGNLWEPVLGDAEASAAGHLDEVATVGTNAGKLISPVEFGFQGIGTPGGQAVNTNEAGSGVNYYMVSTGTIQSQSVAGTAVDPSGNVWVLNGQADPGYANQMFVEFVGLGAPTVTPKSLAQKYGTFSSLP